MDVSLSIHDDPDPVRWAKELMHQFSGRLHEVDEGAMIAWFANAMCAATNNYQRTHEPR